MPKISLAGFKNPASRPRYIIWALVAVLVIAGVMIPVLGVTSTRWFCSEGCHKVQDDTIIAYQHSAHSEISCMACHMPVAANPVIFLIHKAEALGELAQTVTNSYELPLNAESEVALTMTEDKCTQCHSPSTRKFTPSDGHQDRPQGARREGRHLHALPQPHRARRGLRADAQEPRVRRAEHQARGLHADDGLLPLPRARGEGTGTRRVRSMSPRGLQSAPAEPRGHRSVRREARRDRARG